MAGISGMLGMSGMGDGKMSDMHPHTLMMEKDTARQAPSLAAHSTVAATTVFWSRSPSL